MPDTLPNTSQLDRQTRGATHSGRYDMTSIHLIGHRRVRVVIRCDPSAYDVDSWAYAEVWMPERGWVEAHRLLTPLVSETDAHNRDRTEVLEAAAADEGELLATVELLLDDPAGLKETP
jgi:hypothetical protein